MHLLILRNALILHVNVSFSYLALSCAEENPVFTEYFVQKKKSTAFYTEKK